MSIDVFVSYASEDRNIVALLVGALEREGFTVWWDRHIRTGRTYDREIEHAIESSGCVLVVWSRYSIESEWVRTEAAEGLERGCLVPVKIQDTRPPLAFRRVQCIELTDADGLPDRKQLASLVTAVSDVLTGKSANRDVTPREGDRREISYLAARIAGFSALGQRADPEDLETLREGLSTGLSRLAVLYGGFVNQSTDSRFGVVFGLPGSHEDDPVRAVHLGLALVKELAAFQQQQAISLGNTRLSMQVGIDSGLVVAKAGREDTGVYQLSGGCVSRAESMLNLPHEEPVLISAGTLSRVAPYFITRPGGTIPLDEDELACFGVMGPSEVQTRIEAANAHGFTPHRGREVELSMLTANSKRAAAGRGRTVVLTGEAGIGKSRLGHELAATLDPSEFQILEGTCQSYGGQSPYLPFLQVLEELLRLDEGKSDLETTLADAVREIDPSLEAAIPALLHLLSIPPVRHRAILLEGLALRRALQDALVATLTMAAHSRPVLLVLEDWHWADSASDETLQRLVEVCAQHPILLLVSMRPTISPRWLGHSSVSTIQLEPLSENDTAAFICALWQVTDLPEQFVHLMHQTTNGNPFFLEEICRSLEAAQKVFFEDGRVVFPVALEELKFPGSVQAVIRTRLDQLTHSALEVLNLASVIGLEFAQQRLEAIVPQHTNLPVVLNELVNAELIQQSQLLPDPEFEFKHVLTQVVVYESLLRSQRRRMHQLIGEACEQANVDRPEEEIELIAHHFARGEDQRKAIDYTLRAGEKAAARSAIQEAASYFTSAAEMIADVEEAEENQRQRLRALVNLGTALMVVKGYDAPEVIDAFSKALVLSKGLASSREQFSALWGLWRYYYNEAQLIEAREAADKLIEIATSEGEADYVLAANTALGVVDLFSGRLQVAAERFRLAESQIGIGDRKARAVRYGMSPEVMCLSFSALVDSSMGLVQSATEKTTRACVMSEAINHDATRAFAHYYGVAVAALGGELDAADEHVRELDRVAHASEFPHWIALAEYQASMLEAARGSPATALPRILDAKQRAVNMGVRLLEPTYVVSAAPLNLALNRIGEAIVELDAVEQSVGRRGLHYFTPRLSRARGVLLQHSQPERARHYFEQAIRQAETLGHMQPKLQATCDLLALRVPDSDTRSNIRRLEAVMAECQKDTRNSPDYARAIKLLAKARSRTVE